MQTLMMHKRPLLAALSCAWLLCAAPAVAAPGALSFEAQLLANGGGPVADGQYALTLAIYDQAVGGQALWTEGPTQVDVVGGFLTTTFGADQPITPEALAAPNGAWLGVTVGNDPELPRQPLGTVVHAWHAAGAEALSCSGCVAAGQLAPMAVGVDAVDFPYAAADTPAGAATGLSCTGCVSVAEMNFDGDINLGAHSIKAAAVQTGSVVAQGTVQATEFVGDGSKLQGIKVTQGACPAGTSMTGVDQSGQLICSEISAALPKDTADDLSNGVLTNEFVDAFAAAGLPLGIKDNFPVGVSLEIDVPDVGLAKSLTVTVDLTNSDVKDVQVYLYDPNNVEYTLYDKSSSGGTWKGSFPAPDTAAQGDLSTWFGKNPKGKWLLKVIDSSFLDNTTDGEIKDFSVAIQTVSNKKLDVNGNLTVSDLLTATGPIKLPVTNAECTAAREGQVRYNAYRMEFCDGTTWRGQWYGNATYRWAWWSTYSQAYGWYYDNRSELFGGVTPSNWGNGNALASQMSSDSDILRTLYPRRGPAIGTLKNAMIRADEFKNYSSTNSRHVSTLFRVKNTTGQAITWTPYFYITSYSSHNEYASVALNGQNVWSDSTNGASTEKSVNLSIPANRTSTVIFVASSSAPSGDMKSCALAFYNNSLQLPSGLEFVDDLDTKPNGWDN
jgi:subtilisin-like proprotein convertase family protein